MHRITESIEIKRPPQEVFALLRDIEARIKLNPSCNVISFEALNHKEMCAGARFRFFLMINGNRTKYECEVLEFVENKRIVSRAIDGRLQLTLTLTEIPLGTLLTHDEQYNLSDELVYQIPSDTNPLSFLFKVWSKIRPLLLGFDFHDRERERRTNEIDDTLRKVLSTWLGRIKKHLETESA